MYGYIYKTTYLKTGDVYIGQHTSDYVRKYQKIDSWYFGSGKIIQNIIRKYGTKYLKCEIIEWCESKEKLNESEIYHIEKYKKDFNEKCFNVAKGGEGGNNILYLSPTQRKKIKEKEMQTKNTKSEEEKRILAERIRNTLLNKPIEEKIKISKQHSETWHKKPLEEKRRREIDRANTRNSWDEEAKKANSDACRKSKEQPVIVTDGETTLEFDSALICSRTFGWADCMAGMYIRQYGGIIKKKKSPYHGWKIYYK